jgi:glycosyltransferase involved in cell wall biosynthesis
MVTFDPPTGSGGLEGRAMSYTAGMVERAVHVEVAALSPGQKKSEEPYLGTRLVRLSSSIVNLPSTISTLLRMMRDSSLDSVFMLSGGSTAVGNLVLGYSRLTGRRSGIFFYGKDILQTKRRPAGRITLALSILLAGGVGTNSSYTAGLLPLKPRRPLTIIYPGVDASIAQGLARVGRDQRSPRVLFVGRLIRRKGADLLLTAVSQLKSELPGLRVDIVGDGPEFGNLRALAEALGLKEIVTFHGALYGPRLWSRYAEASLFAMPSRQSPYDTEGFGTVFLEAGAFGLPSIGTRTGGIPEAVIDGTTGRLVDSEDVVGLRNTIRSLLENPGEMERLGRNAQKRASALSWGASTNQVLRLLGDEAPRLDKSLNTGA